MSRIFCTHRKGHTLNTKFKNRTFILEAHSSNFRGIKQRKENDPGYPQSRCRSSQITSHFVVYTYTCYIQHAYMPVVTLGNQMTLGGH